MLPLWRNFFCFKFYILKNFRLFLWKLCLEIYTQVQMQKVRNAPVFLRCRVETNDENLSASLPGPGSIHWYGCRSHCVGNVQRWIYVLWIYFSISRNTCYQYRACPPLRQALLWPSMVILLYAGLLVEPSASCRLGEHSISRAAAQPALISS